jgi:hypothetical protein
MVKTYNCTDGGAQRCQGCYTMEESTDHNGKPDGYGEWVSKEAYDALADAAQELVRVLTMEENESFPAMDNLKRLLGWFDVPDEFASDASAEPK